MPFNSTQNSYFGNYYPEQSFQVLKNSYAIPKEGYNQLPYTQLTYRPTATVEQFIRPANIHSHISYLDQDELKYINNEQRKHVKEELVGEGVGNFRIAKHNIDKNINHAFETIDNNTIKVGGNIFKKVKKATKKVANKTVDSFNVVKGVEETIAQAKEINEKTKPAQRAIVKSTVNKNGVIHKGIVKFNDIAIPMAGQAVGTAVGAYMGNPAAGAIVGKAAGQVGRDVLKTETGYGVKGVGKYKKEANLDKIITKYVPELASGTKKATGGGKKIASTVSDRNKVVRDVMREKGLSLPQASKYVKDNNLWTK